jgi:hypothetical protein
MDTGEWSMEYGVRYHRLGTSNAWSTTCNNDHRYMHPPIIGAGRDSGDRFVCMHRHMYYLTMGGKTPLTIGFPKCHIPNSPIYPSLPSVLYQPPLYHTSNTIYNVNQTNTLKTATTRYHLGPTSGWSQEHFFDWT